MGARPTVSRGLASGPVARTSRHSFRALGAPALAGALLALLTGCKPISAPGGPFAAVWPELREQADSLLAARQPEAAEQRLRVAQAVLRAPWAPEWQLRELACGLEDWREWPGRRSGERDSLMQAAADVRAARRASQHDSLDAAERLAASAYATRLALLGSASAATASAALELADLSFRLSRIARTDSLASAAMVALERAFGPRHPELALAHEQLGRSLKNYHGGTALPRALEFYQEALRMRVETVGPHASAIAGAFHEIGNLERSRRAPAAALDAFRVALALRRETYGPVDDAVASTLTAMAILEGAR
ncbi:MAG: tetratricopeptide repeat protein, partial [Candidatus Eisenbacteria bacterium]